MMMSHYKLMILKNALYLTMPGILNTVITKSNNLTHAGRHSVIKRGKSVTSKYCSCLILVITCGIMMMVGQSVSETCWICYW